MIVTLTACVLLAADGPPPTPPLVTLAELQTRLDEPNLRILDARPKAQYEAGHVPGAVWVDVKAAEALAAKPGGLTDVETWSRWVAPLGLPDRGEVLIYGDNRQLDAARVWWLLTYLGVERVGLVDGNYGVWAREHRPAQQNVPDVAPRSVAIKFAGGRLASREDVAKLLTDPGPAVVIDARTLGEHEGTEKRSARAGRIPSACRLEWVDLVDKDGRFLSEPDLRAKVEAAGIKPGSPVVTHCQGGGRASVDAFVFERLGHPARNYYLGWSDWGNAEGVPVEAGSTRKP